MTNQLTTMLATPYYVDTTSITVTTDVTSSEVKTLPAGYYIPYIKFDNSAEIAGVTRGTLNDPYEVFLKFVSASSPTYFSFSLTSQGKTQIEYLGTGSGNITFSYITQKMLGFKSSSLSFASQAVKHVSDYSPYSSIFSFAKTNNSGWTKTPQAAAYSMTPDGYVWGYKNSYDTYTQKFNLRFHPKDQTTQLSDSSINSTPLYFPSKSIYLSNLENPLTVYYSWNNLLTFPGFQQGDSVTLENLKYCAYTVQEFLHQCPGQPIHALLGNFQQCISGSNKEYLVVFQTPESIKKENQFKPSLANFDKLYDVEDFEISFYKKFTTNTLSSSYVTASTAFVPTDITGLQAWWQADDVTISGGKITQFNDKSGNGRHATNANTTYQLTQSVDAAYNSKTVAITNGNGNQVYAPTSFTVNQPFTIFAIGNGRIADWETFIDSNNVNRVIFRKDPSHNIVVYAGNTNVTVAVLDARNPVIAWCEYNGVSSKGNVNSNTATAISSPGTNALTQPILFGGSGGGVYPLANGSKFAALLIYNKVLTTQERTNVLSYFATYYGISVSGL